MGIEINFFILIFITSNILILNWFLFRKIGRLHKEIRIHESKLKLILESLEKKMCSEELDAREIKDDLKKIQIKIVECEHIISHFPVVQLSS